ncbi:MAG: hypothetical protein ACYS8Z_07405 [Planctomycetota bacterium]|jgi:hypothetical protein
MAAGIWTTETLVAAAQNALDEAAECMPRYAHPFLSKDFTEHQLYAIQVLRRLLKTDIQGVIEKIERSAELCRVLGLENIPDYATLFQADARLVRKGFLEKM